MIKRRIERGLETIISKKEDKVTIKIKHEMSISIIEKAMEKAIDNTLNEMVKCKEVEAINNLAILREQQHRILSIALNNTGHNNIIISLIDIEVLHKALSEYKTILTSEIKKSNNIDELCDKMFYCNKLLSQIA